MRIDKSYPQGNTQHNIHNAMDLCTYPQVECVELSTGLLTIGASGKTNRGWGSGGMCATSSPQLYRIF